MGGITKFFKFDYKPIGFSWMVFVDRDDFDRAHYDFTYVHREFLGDVRCIVFDVTPAQSTPAKAASWAASGWKIRITTSCGLNGTYVPTRPRGLFFHMDSWRVNAGSRLLGSRLYVQ